MSDLKFNLILNFTLTRIWPSLEFNLAWTLTTNPNLVLTIDMLKGSDSEKFSFWRITHVPGRTDRADVRLDIRKITDVRV